MNLKSIPSSSIILYTCIAALGFTYVLETVLNVSLFSLSLALLSAIAYQVYAMQKRPEYAKELRIDRLTGLMNRDGFLTKLDSIIRKNATASWKTPFAVIVLDINKFKAINESLGYESGDKLLIHVAHRLSKLVADVGDLARIGSDDYAMIVRSSLGYQDFCDKLFKAFLQPIEFNDHSITVGIRVGASLYPEHSESACSLLKMADIALSECKKTQAKCRMFEYSMTSESYDSAMASSLSYAIENNLLVFQYQPQLDLHTNSICGVEALIRWKHPDYGLLKPEKFIAVAEQANLIDALTRWTVREGVSKLSKILTVNSNLTFSINISPLALLDTELLVELARETVNNSIPYKSITFEINESALSNTAVEKVCAGLQMLGVELAIDNFGTGQSSLLNLKHLQAKDLKISRVFINHMLHNSKDLAIVRSVIDMAHSLGCRVIAEGVETESVKQKLAEFGCDALQGYIYSRPMFEEEFFEFLEASNAES
jgi:diguanylate cyclase (GGDEF)-like protein